jgi:hypothetical protein
MAFAAISADLRIFFSCCLHYVQGYDIMFKITKVQGIQHHGKVVGMTCRDEVPVPGAVQEEGEGALMNVAASKPGTDSPLAFTCWSK